MAALLAALPKLIALVLAIVEMVKTGKAQGDGADSIIQKVLQRAIDDIQIAAKAEVDADAEHKAHPNDDSGFDPTFRRD